jgi:tripartite-type tricarboxylate transporter receptor subunit TctC
MSGQEIRNGVRICLLLLALAIASASSLRAGDYPDHSVKVIVPFPPGGATDIAGRIITQKLSERLGRQFFIENISGAGGNIGMAIAARAPPDGYTILLASSSIVVNPNLYKSIPFDVEKELIDLMKASPGKYSVASPGAGTTPSLAIEMLKQALGVSFVTIPFAGGGPLAQSLLGGFTPISCNAVSSTIALIKAGKVRALALTSKQHLETLPSVPTLDELDIRNQESETMAGVFVPSGTPQAIVDLLQKEIVAIVHMADVKQRLLEVATIPDGDSSADFSAYVGDEIAKWKRVIEVGKIDRI